MPLEVNDRALAGVWVIAVSTAVAAAALGQASWLEAFGFVTGAVCVWLTVKQSVWNFPLSLMNVGAFLFVFAQARLYADAGLQVVYFILTVIGWWMWLYGGKGRTALRVTQVTPVEAAIVATCGVVLFVGLWRLLNHIGGSATMLDALTTSLSLCAQWLLNRKRLATWYCWIAVDVIYIPLYAYKHLYLTSILYAVFLCMATIGLLEWRKAYRQQHPVLEPVTG
jgi:nicotinamide mononucleotide transporter